MGALRQAVRRAMQKRAVLTPCTADHHWHYQSPFTHGLTAVRGSGWKRCNCPSFVPASGARPEPAGRVQCTELAGESERLDRVERWLDQLQNA